ncbi:MAG: bifunctional YncE family protein/alkaline phosphatase family protein [Fimbriimonas sp.]|nr:bifunctional YncE family protein/alkaline phosphatase family protein [Fimbriimonas sp.]
MKREAVGVIFVGLVAVGFAGRMVLVGPQRDASQAPVNQVDESGARVWPNGWKTSPAGKFVELPGDMPASIIPLPDGRRALVNTCGYHDHSVSLVDIGNGKVLDSVVLPRLWIGLSYDATTNEVLVSGGSGKNPTKKKKRAKSGSAGIENTALIRFKLDGDKLVNEPGVSIPGLAEDARFVSSVTRHNGDLLVANIQNDTVYRLGAEGVTVKASRQVGYRPYGLALSPDGANLAVSNWGDASVSLLDSASLEEKARIKVGSHPNALQYLPDGRLVVANSGSDTLSILSGSRVIESVRVTLLPRDPLGAAPIALAYSDVRKQLFAANSDNNCVAVVDVHAAGHSRVVGFIPTGRYPSALALSADGGQLLIGTAKGLSSSLNAGEKEAMEAKAENGEVVVPHKYVGDVLSGHLASVDLPGPEMLAKYTQAVYDDRPDGTKRLRSVVAPGIAQGLRKIEHVVYVIKENRTYDQVLGDDSRGNGDRGLVMFGEKVTPNEHKLADQFVLFDNLFCDGEVSQVGHQWTDGAYAGDYTEKQWTLSYGGHEEVESDERLHSSPGGFIWQNAKKHGRSARIYGEYIQWQEDHNSAHGDVKKDPEKYGCSAEFEKVFARGGRDTEKVDVFMNELRAAEKTGKWPNLMVMALNEDHTRGMSAGTFSPQAMVASNDQAVGKLIEGISHSRFWSTTAVFVIEDDAQDGPDHVDCHRTTGFFICPLVKRGLVDHTQYSTSSMIRTMELMLGLPPMSQYDANAMPMLACLNATPDPAPYEAVPAQIDLMKRNPAKGELAARSAKLDFSDIDRADPKEFNDILWQATHGGSGIAPAPTHGMIR